MEGRTINFTLTDSYQIRQYNSDKFLELNNHFVPVPYINNSKNKFTENLKVELKSIKNSVIKYQISATENYELSKFISYKKPFVITKKCYVHFLSIIKKDSSKVVTQPFYKIQNDKTIQVLTSVNPMYTAGGKESLIDGIEGTANWRAGEWQSYYGNNFEAIIGFKVSTTIDKINLRFLQDIKSWIWVPRKIKIYTSSDNINFIAQNTFIPAIDEKNEENIVCSFVIPIQKTKTKFVKIVAENFETIPSWHLGAGNKAHIFISEIGFN